MNEHRNEWSAFENHVLNTKNYSSVTYCGENFILTIVLILPVLSGSPDHSQKSIKTFFFHLELIVNSTFLLPITMSHSSQEYMASIEKSLYRDSSSVIP